MHREVGQGRVLPGLLHSHDSAPALVRAAIPESTKDSLLQRLTAHTRTYWPQIERVITRYRASHDDYGNASLPAKPWVSCLGDKNRGSFSLARNCG